MNKENFGTDQKTTWNEVKNDIFARLLPVDYVKCDDEVITEVTREIRVGYRIKFTRLYSIVIRKSMLTNWGISEDTLYRQAVKNMPEMVFENLANYSYRNTPKALREEMGLTEDALIFNQSPFTVFSNRDYNTYGAVQIINLKNLDKIYSAVKTSFYLNPISVHEWFVLPCQTLNPQTGEYVTPDELLEFLEYGNSNYTSPDDVLGNFILKYDGKKITRVA